MLRDIVNINRISLCDFYLNFFTILKPVVCFCSRCEELDIIEVCGNSLAQTAKQMPVQRKFPSRKAILQLGYNTQQFAKFLLDEFNIVHFCPSPQSMIYHSHHTTESWRNCVLAGDSREKSPTPLISRRRAPLPLPLHPLDHLRQHRLALFLAFRVNRMASPRPVRVPG